ncbi:LytR/AlgR family response regulator transcription factor [Pedobacter cryoconitis]|uniref:LytTR family two component transcriptional regulator n=1 Tax=Pedobacter cryoconitis TaxID=188932 RepID=A0A327SCV5_9SPHI|nr:LytTR family DNA-binding domain-containing protein [Pedobacter cryoconitis]RAJ26906.1 LytTR family two component transcriptional regulator [Pedobacter cryoconitis]
MIRSCYIIDDELHGIEVLAKYVQQTPGLELIGTETDPLEALRKISTKEIKPDITFLDVEMPELSGIELSYLIRDKTEIVFSTAFKNYAYRAYDANAIDFLLKPISYERFLQALDKIYAKKNTAPIEPVNNFIFIQPDNKKNHLKLNTDEITHIEGLSNYVKIHTQSEKVYTIYTSLKLILEKLPPSLFLRSHKSFIVNLKFVEVINGNEITIKGNHIIPIGGFFRKELMNKI